MPEPIGVGYSYSDEGEVNNSPAAAEDVFAFLQLFIMNVRVQADLPDTILMAVQAILQARLPCRGRVLRR